ncbi:hypothetical protein HDU98_004298 [Podochytrium sp. JEL0797]|nr:hypothetical protein HDU98_004298 [Podochytrium sp. JEL0797]
MEGSQSEVCTSLMDVPHEVLLPILSWISPTQVFLYREVCTGFNALLITKHFAVVNLRRFPPSKNCCPIISGDEEKKHLSSDRYRVSKMEQVFFHGPASFQTVFAETRLRPTTVIKWDRNPDYPTCHIPTAISLCVNLKVLDLSQCRLKGPIPAQLSLLGSLTHLDLSDNQLDGEIPVELGGIRSLVLGKNELTGGIPVEVGELLQLQVLNLSHNRLTGEIPGGIRKLVNLRTLWLGSNELTGEIPIGIWEMKELESLGLDWNRLSGSIPTLVGNLTRLEYLSLHCNKLSDSVPREVMLLSNLKDCNLGYNEELSCDFEWEFWEQK